MRVLGGIYFDHNRFYLTQTLKSTISELRLGFYTEPATKAIISQRDSQPCKHMPQTEEEQHAQDKS